MLKAFDLDGVLVDTREANLRAYRYVGVEPPGNFHVIPWQRWTSEVVHDAKNISLQAFRSLIKPLPYLSLLDEHSFILSNCSDAALEVIRSCVGALRNRVVVNKLDGAAKVKALQEITRNGNVSGIYWDDCAETCALVKTYTEWQACRVL